MKVLNQSRSRHGAGCLAAAIRRGLRPLLLLALLATTPAVLAGETETLHYLSAGGGVSAPPLAVGNHLYASTGSTITTWNLQSAGTPASSRTSAWREPGSIAALANTGDVLYAATLSYTPAPDIGIRGGGITVYSLADPDLPTPVSWLTIAEDVLGYPSAPHLMAASASALYAVDQYGAVITYSLANPLEPTFAGAVAYPGNFYSFLNQATSVTINQNRLIVTGFTDGANGRYISVLIYDISNPLAPTVAGFRQLDGPGFGPVFAESNAVVVTPNNLAVIYGFRLAVFDLADPQNIQLRYGAEAYPREGVTGASAVVRGNHVYISTQPLCTFGNCGNGGTLGLDVWDISSPAAPNLVQTLPIDISVNSYNQAANTTLGPVFVGARNEATVLDVTVPSHPTRSRVLPLLTSAGRVDTLATKAAFDERGLAYVIGGSHGFSVVEPRTLQPVGRFESALNPVIPPENADIALQDSRAYYVDNNGLAIVDITNPQAPTRLGAFDLPVEEGVAKVAVQGQRAYVTTFSTLRILDIANPAAPQLLGSYEGFYVVAGTAVRGNRAFVVAQTDPFSPFYLFLLDVSNAAAPQLLSQTAGCEDPAYSPDRLAVNRDGTRAYVAAAGCGTLDIFDTSNAAAPALLGRYQTPDEGINPVNDVALASDGRLYAGTALGVDLVDVSNPAAPVQLERFAPLASSAARVSRSAAGVLMFFSYRQDGVATYAEDRLFADGFIHP